MSEPTKTLKEAVEKELEKEGIIAELPVMIGNGINPASYVNVPTGGINGSRFLTTKDILDGDIDIEHVRVVADGDVLIIVRR